MTEIVWVIDVVCTDRGRHKTTYLTQVHGVLKDVDGTATVDKSMAITKWWYPPTGTVDKPRLSAGSYQFQCPRCSRNPRIGGERWLESLRRVVTETSLTQVDISVLS